MKVLMFGTGVIGTIYGYVLAQAGNDVTHYVREGKKKLFRTESISSFWMVEPKNQNRKTLPTRRNLSKASRQQITTIWWSSACDIINWILSFRCSRKTSAMRIC